MVEGSTSAQRKLERGVEHAKALCREAVAFQERNAYALRVEEEPRPPKHTQYTCYAVEREQPPPHWPVLAGDAIQNLRAALEHAVWGATPPRRRKRTQFPIFKDACEFQVLGRPMIAGLEEAIRTFIEEAQPCNGPFRDAPEYDPLWSLSVLSNLDKHRTLTTVAASIEMPYVGWDGVEGDDFEFTYVGFRKPLHENAKVLAFYATKGVKVDPNLIYEVTVEGRPLIQTMQQIVRRVFELISMIETGLRPPFDGRRRYPVL